MAGKINTQKLFANLAVFAALSVLPLSAFAALPLLVPCGNSGQPSCDFNMLVKLVQNIINFLVYMSAPVAAVAFAWAGVLYFTAAGDEKKIGEAHNIFTTVLIGLGIVLSAWLIVKLIVTGLGVKSGLSPLR